MSFAASLTVVCECSRLYVNACYSLHFPSGISTAPYVVVQTRDREAGVGELKVQDGCACRSGSQYDRPEQKIACCNRLMALGGTDSAGK